METKLSDIIKYGNYNPEDTFKITNLLRQSSKYKTRIKVTLRGTVVEGELSEILDEIDLLSSQGKTSQDSTTSSAQTNHNDNDDEELPVLNLTVPSFGGEGSLKKDESEEQNTKEQNQSENNNYEYKSNPEPATNSQQYEYTLSEQAVFELQGARGRRIKIFNDHAELRVDPTAGAFLTGNISDGTKVIFYKDVIGIQFKESKGIIGYLQLETASGLTNNSSNNLFNENTFTYEHGKANNPSNERMKVVVEYVIRRVSLYKQLPHMHSYLTAADEIRKFKELLDIGAITQDEYEIKKKQLLNA